MIHAHAGTSTSFPAGTYLFSVWFLIPTYRGTHRHYLHPSALQAHRLFAPFQLLRLAASASASMSESLLAFRFACDTIDNRINMVTHAPYMLHVQYTGRNGHPWYYKSNNATIRRYTCRHACRLYKRGSRLNHKAKLYGSHCMST